MVYLLFGLGFVALVKGADFLIEGATALAQRFGVSKLVIGLTIVALGTSMPEFAVNVFAAVKDVTDVAFGNVVGSNLANTLLVLGAMSLVFPTRLHRSTVWRDIPFSLLAAVVLLIIANDLRIDALADGALASGWLTRVDGLVMLSFFAVFIYYMWRVAASRRNDLVGEGIDIPVMSRSQGILWVSLGIVGLYFGGRWIVDGAVAIAGVLGVGNYAVSASVVALGTSLPELATSLRAAWRRDSDLAVGNIIGSNIFNIFGILGITAVIAPVTIPSTINASIILLILATTLLFVFSLLEGRYRIGRSEGLTLMVMYLGYVIYLFA